MSPFLRLVPSNLVVEVEDLDVPGYNNMIKEEDDPGVHFGFNSAINLRASSKHASSELTIVPTEGGPPVVPVALEQGPDLRREEARNMLIAGGLIIATIAVLR